MKKIILLLTMALASAIAYGQTADAPKQVENDGKNEIKINLLNAILALPEINYERLLADNMGVGVALSFGIGNDDDFSQYKFLAIPHYRIYFGKKNAAGFFIEGNAAIGSVRERQYGHYDYYSGTYYPLLNNASLHVGFGAAVGAKFLTRNGFLGEIYTGAGRFLGDNRNVEAYPRVGIAIGKRF